MDDLELFDQQILDALLAGFRARAGAKERFQALSEYEVARRIGVTSYSYVEYDTSAERERVRASLQRLQRRGLVRVAAVSGRYETFAPGQEVLARPCEAPASEAPLAPDVPAEAPRAAAAEPPLPTTFEGRLDEIIRLLRSIEAHLARLERG